MKVVIRGAGRAELTTRDGQVTVSGSEDTTWVEQNVVGVTALRIRVANGDGAPYTVGAGLVRVAGVEHPASTGGTVSMPDAEAVAVPVEPPTPEPPQRILPPDPQLQRPEPQHVAAPPAEPVAPAAPVPVPGPLGGPSVDALTGPIPAVEAGEAPVARLIFSSGQVVDVDRPVVVGRAPDPGRVGDDDRARLVTVPSPHHEISSTHVEIRPGEGADLGSAVVTDLGSTNGTVVVQPGLPADDLQPGIAVQLTPGATIDLGEGVTIQVTRA